MEINYDYYSQDVLTPIVRNKYKPKSTSDFARHHHSFGRVNHNARRRSSGLKTKVNSNGLVLSELDTKARALIHRETIIHDFESFMSECSRQQAKSIKFPYWRPVAIASRRRDVQMSKQRRDRDLVHL
jgi:hypothetical protein